MTETLIHHVQAVMSSPWVYALLFVLAALDGFFPVVPSESAVITAGVFAASGGPEPLAVIAAAALGAAAGDHTSYLIGRAFGGRLLSRSRPGTRRRAALDRAAEVLSERGGLVLVVARYIPGGRTAATLTMGALGHPLRRFTVYDCVAVLSWACYATLIGYAGGAAFEHDPAKGLLAGLAIAISITVLVEAVRHLRTRTAGKGQGPACPPDAGARVLTDGRAEGRSPGKR